MVLVRKRTNSSISWKGSGREKGERGKEGGKEGKREGGGLSRASMGGRE
jgi:hypothetical protein